MPTPNDLMVAELRRMGYLVRRQGEWGSRYISSYQARRIDMPVKLPAPFAYQHITVTRDDGILTGNFDADMRELERIGYERFRSGISYNWPVDAITGMIGEGMPVDAKGTHTVNDKNVPGFPNNLNYYGNALAMIGMPGTRPTTKFIGASAAILAVSWKLNILQDFSPYFPHSKFAAKDCPTDFVRAVMPLIHATAKDFLHMPDGITPMTPVAGIKDPDGSSLVYQEAVIRGNWAYMNLTGQLEAYNRVNGLD